MGAGAPRRPATLVASDSQRRGRERLMLKRDPLPLGRGDGQAGNEGG